jgi:hypothetical protein
MLDRAQISELGKTLRQGLQAIDLLIEVALLLEIGGRWAAAWYASCAGSTANSGTSLARAARGGALLSSRRDLAAALPGDGPSK